MERTRWTEEELFYIRAMYEDSPKNEIRSVLPKRSWVAIKLMGRKMGLFQYRRDNKKSDMRVLLNDTDTTYYWLGFLFADGHFAENGRMAISLAVLDFQHLQRLGLYLGVELDRVKLTPTMCHLSIMDVNVVGTLKDKFNISNRKTYSPPDITSILSGDHFIPWLIGFIDGDGSVRLGKNRRIPNIVIKKHSSWLTTLCDIANKVGDILHIEPMLPVINRCGYSELVWSNVIVINFLKNFVVEHRLPVLDRKWSKIDQAYLGRRKQAEINKSNTLLLHYEGYSCKRIADKLGLSCAGVYAILRKHRK